jgi:hypothetical protein
MMKIRLFPKCNTARSRAFRHCESAGRRVGGLVIVLALVLVGVDSQAGEHTWVGAKKCKSCHKKEAIGNQYGWWLESEHAKAPDSLATEKAAKWAKEAGVPDPTTDERCVKCHETAYGVPDNLVAKKFRRGQGVQCEACHGPGKDYRKKKVMVDRDVAVSKGLILQTEEVCVACHNDDSPAWDPERYTRADGSKVGFDFDQAAQAIAHPVPEGYDPAADEDDAEEEE